MKSGYFKNILVSKNLKVTPQRLAVLDAVTKLKNHPSSEEIQIFIQRHHPSISQGTIYKTLETFVVKGIIQKVKTEKDYMRFDAITARHHHLYCVESEKIVDYFDQELDEWLALYFQQKQLPNFKYGPALSGPKPEDNWDGETGLITQVLDRHLANGDNLEAYLCGSPGMIDASVKVLTAKGIPEELIFYDKFA